MRKMVQTAEADRDTAIQRSAMVAKQAAQQTSEDVRGQLEKLSGLERDHMKLTAQHSIAEVSCCITYAHNGISYSFSVQSSQVLIIKHPPTNKKTMQPPSALLPPPFNFLLEKEVEIITTAS